MLDQFPSAIRPLKQALEALRAKRCTGQELAEATKLPLSTARVLITMLHRLGLLALSSGLTGNNYPCHMWGLTGWDYSTSPPKPPEPATLEALALEVLQTFGLEEP